MNIKNTLGRAAGIAAAAVAITGLCLTGAASASTASPAATVVRGCSIQTVNGHYLTAAVRVGSWEKFSVVFTNGSHVYGLQTVNGHYLTAVGGGGRITDVIHSDAPWLRAWEEFTLNYLGNGQYSIETVNGHYLTAVGGGGRITDTIHSDATRVGSWEKFRISCSG